MEPSRRISAGRYTNERLRNVLLGYARISKTDGSQVLDLQRDALIEAAVKPDHIYEDQASGKRDDRLGLAACLKALREGDVLVVWKLDRLGRDLRHLVNTVQDLCDRGVGLRVLTGQGAQLDTTTASGRLVFGIFAALAEFERELIRARTGEGRDRAKARGVRLGRKPKLTAHQRQEALVRREAGEPLAEIARSYGVHHSTISRLQP